MLPRANRVTLPADFRTTLRRGRRRAGANAVVHVFDRADSGPARFGFVVAKTVGNAVTRNLVKRRLRAIGAEILGGMSASMDVVIRALPASATASWVSLHTEITEGVSMEMART